MLDYSLAEKGDLSLYEYLYRRIRDDIVSGAIAAEDRLPSKRSLARHLGVSLITVENAYAQLVAEGYVHARPRSGYFASRVEVPESQRLAAVAGTHARGNEAEVEAPPPDRAVRGGWAEEAGGRLWARALRQTLASEPEEELYAPAPSRGVMRLRVAIADHLRQTRGLMVDPDQVVVAAGAQLLDIMFAQLMGTGTVVAVEDPGYERLTRLYQMSGCEVRHVSLDAQGPCMASLEQKSADVLHLMPSHQFPTGRVTSIARRYELLGWVAAKPDRYLVEDDYDCEFRLEGKPVPPLAGIDALGRVVYTNTFSKSLGPAIRLAYMVLPAPLDERRGSDLGFYSSSVGTIDQIALARLLESGDYERHVARMRKRCRDLRDELLDVLRDCPIAALEEADSGLHAMLVVRGPAEEKRVRELARAEGLELTPLSSYCWRGCGALEREHDARGLGADGNEKRFVLRYDTLPAGAGTKLAAFLAAVSREDGGVLL